MAKHRTYSIEFKRQAAQEFHEAGESVPARGRITDGAGERALAADLGERRVEEGFEVGQHRRRASLSDFLALGRNTPANVGLDRE